jgi:hypothetical protein
MKRENRCRLDSNRMRAAGLRRRERAFRQQRKEVAVHSPVR